MGHQVWKKMDLIRSSSSHRLFCHKVYLMMEGVDTEAPKSNRAAVRRAVFVLFIIETEVMSDGRGRNSNAFMNGLSLLSDAAEKHTDTDELPFCARMYISSVRGEVCGRVMSICAPVYVSTITLKLMMPGTRVPYNVVVPDVPYQNVARTR